MSQFTQKVPIPSYLLAIAIGAVESRRIGPRSLVWAEPELLDLAASDFSDTESMLRTAEDLAGPYVWERFGDSSSINIMMIMVMMMMMMKMMMMMMMMMIMI